MKNLTLTDDELNRQSEIETKYTFYKKHTDPSMGEISLLKNTAGSVICYKEQIKNSKEQFAQAIMEARERLNLNHKYLIEMKDYSTKQKNDFCSTFYTIRTFFEYQMNNLQKEIKHRKDGGIDFSMIELTHLLYNIAEAGSYLQDRGKAHGDIRPSSIAVMEEGKSFKLIDRIDPNVSALQSQLNYIFSGKELYLTPQLFNALKKNNMKVNHNEYKSDVFSFGLCILEAGLKRGVGSIYTENSFNPNELQKLIDEFHRKYDDNPLLVTTVKKMLSIDEADRPDFKTIINAIPPYKEIVEFFEGEDQYFEGGEDFTSSRYAEGGDYMLHGHNGQMYNPHHQGGLPQAPGFPHQDPRYAQQFPPQGYGAPTGPYHPQGGHADHHQFGQPAPIAHATAGFNPYAPQPSQTNAANPMIYPQQTSFPGHPQAGTTQYGHQDHVHAIQGPHIGNQGALQYSGQQAQLGQPQHMLHAHSSPLYSPQGAVAGSQNIYSPQPHLGHQVVSDPHTGLGQQTTQMFTSSHQPGSQVRPGLQGAGAYNQTLIGSQPIQSNPSRAPGSLLAQPQQPNATGYGYTNAGGAGLTMQGGAEGDIKVINGRRYREVKEERTEVNERGQAVKKFIVKLEPLDENVKKVDPTGSLSTQGGLSGTSSQYSNYNVGYNQGAPTTFTGFIPR